MKLEKTFKPYLQAIDKEINRIDGDERVTIFYEPINYVLSLKGKRIRPLLLVLSAAALGAKPQDAYCCAAAVELLHNFTLVHDDIMDNDSTRRGQPTVHIKWDVSTAILSGDGLMGFAFKKLLKARYGDIRAMASCFTNTMIVICEGQGLDKMFEGSDKITVDDYLDMISRKTAVLIELSCQLGGMVAGGSDQQTAALRNFGYALGMGFQIQDDLLDVMADEARLGKKVGSDLAMNKQTILTILLRNKKVNKDFSNLSVQDFRGLLKETNVLQEVTDMYESYFETAYKNLAQLPQNKELRLLKCLTDYIKNREW